MNKDDNILSVANSYTQGFWINPDYARLPRLVKDEIKILSVIFTEDIGGLLVLRFNETGDLILETRHDEGDYYYDEIGAGLRVRRLIEDKKELFESLELFYATFINKVDKD